MKLKFTEYNQKFITSMEEAGFLLVGATIGLLESRANFLLEVEGDRKAMGITFSGTEQEIKQKGWTNPNLPKLGKSSNSRLRKFHRINVCGISIKAQKFMRRS